MSRTFDANDLVKDVVCIVEETTGLIFDVQCGGMNCNHPTVEGYLIDMGEYAVDIDDCSFGCQHLQELPDKQKELADHLQAYFDSNQYSQDFYIKFDYERLPQLQEGWWPVLIMTDNINWKTAYIHTGNCD